VPTIYPVMGFERWARRDVRAFAHPTNLRAFGD